MNGRSSLVQLDDDEVLVVARFAMAESAGVVPDERLRLIFICAHPALADGRWT
jgi:predicted RNA polymerase sigma factor